MTISSIEINEYECQRCGYKWTNRVNGKDGPIPRNCGKCKSAAWNREKFTPIEIGLRRRIKQLKRFYRYPLPDDEFTWNEKVVEEFLRSRPTLSELKKVFRPANSLISVESQYIAGRDKFCYIPDPNNPKYLKYDSEKYYRILKREAIQRQEIMQQIIKNRLEQKKH
jgi:hypothetical protein